MQRPWRQGHWRKIITLPTITIPLLLLLLLLLLALSLSLLLLLLGLLLLRLLLPLLPLRSVRRMIILKLDVQELIRMLLQ